MFRLQEAVNNKNKEKYYISIFIHLKFQQSRIVGNRNKNPRLQKLQDEKRAIIMFAKNRGLYQPRNSQSDQGLQLPCTDSSVIVENMDHHENMPI